MAVDKLSASDSVDVGIVSSSEPDEPRCPDCGSRDAVLTAEGGKLWCCVCGRLYRPGQDEKPESV